VRVLADSHAVLWYTQGSRRLSPRATSALTEAEATDGVIVSVASLVDLWYVTQTTKALTEAEVSDVRKAIITSPAFTLQPIDLDVADATTAIPRDMLADPWDRFIVATAKVLEVPLVTRDNAIRDSGLVLTIR
jgi:PIN domain nuclease of toxin-antitoxin system